MMMKNYLTFNFGESYFRDKSVLDLMIEKMPVSISLGLWLTLVTNFVSVPLGIRKAVKDGTNFDVWTSGVIIVGYAIPSFILAIMLIVLFAGGSYFSWFPLARSHLGQFRPNELAAKRSATMPGIWCCRCLRSASAVSPP